MAGTRWARWTALAGVLFVAFFAVGFFMVSTPEANASAAKISHFYLNHKSAVQVSAVLTYLAVFAGTWFYVQLWRYFASFEGVSVPAAASLVGAVFFAMSGLVSAGINFAFTDHPHALNDGALVALNSLENDLSYPMTIVGLAVFYVAAAIAIRKTRAFPQWLGWVSWVFAAAALVPFVAFFALLATPLWVLVACVLLVRMPARSLDATATVDLAAQMTPAQV